jgi:hypothetical protein
MYLIEILLCFFFGVLNLRRSFHSFLIAKNLAYQHMETFLQGASSLPFASPSPSLIHPRGDLYSIWNGTATGILLHILLSYAIIIL